VLTGILAALLYHRTGFGTLRGGKARAPGRCCRSNLIRSDRIVDSAGDCPAEFAAAVFHDMMMKAVEQARRSSVRAPTYSRFLQAIHTPARFRQSCSVSVC